MSKALLEPQALAEQGSSNSGCVSTGVGSTAASRTDEGAHTVVDARSDSQARSFTRGISGDTRSSHHSFVNMLLQGVESGIHDPEDGPSEDAINAVNPVMQESLGLSAHDISFANSFVSHDSHGQLEAFEARKKRIELGFGPAWGGAMLLANTLLGGSGMLGIPHAFSVAGYGLGSALIVIFGCCSAFGCHLLYCSAKKVARAPCSFYSVSKAVIPRWTWLVDAAVGIKCAGVATSYLIIVGDLVPEAMKCFGVHVERWICILVVWFVGAVMASLKNLSALRYTASLAIVIVFWTAAIIILFYFRVSPEFDPCPGYDGELPCHGAGHKAVGTDYLKLAQGLPVFIFGFTCQQNIFTICNEVDVASKKRVNLFIITPAYIATAGAFLITAILGYRTYGDRVESDILKDYPSNTIVGITKFGFSAVAIASYPLQIHPSRLSWLELIRWVRPSGPAASQDRWDEVQASVEKRRYWCVTIVLIFGSLGVALALDSLGIILGIVGATGSTTVSYILPGLVYFVQFKTWTLKRCLALVQLMLGCVIMPTCLVVLFL